MATEQDLPQLAELRWDFRDEDGFEQPVISQSEFVTACITFLKRGLESGYHTYWVAERAGEIIAQIFVHRIDLVPRPCKVKDQFGYITNNYTKPAHRNQGIGSELIKRVQQWASAEDLELLIVYPSDEAVTFYERAGFRSDNDVMELKLREYYSPAWSKNETNHRHERPDHPVGL
jgi:GNAT superfamily N-acetyltransferase